VTSKWSAAHMCVLVGVFACGEANTQAKTHPIRAPSFTAVLVDRSTSRKRSEVTQDQHLVETIINNLEYGDRILILQVHWSGRQDGARQWVTQMPFPRDSTAPTPVDAENLRRNRSAAAVAATQFFDSVRPNQTDLFATFFDVSEVVRERDLHRSRIVVLSDMLQSSTASGNINMEPPKGVPDSSWLATQEQQGLLPHLDGTCVTVIGADPSTPHGKSVLRFWQQYFRETGSRLEPSNYRYLLFDVQQLGC
jgi:hypothetical protein